MSLRILLAPNAFKGCLSASDAAHEMLLGARRAVPHAAFDIMPVSDGGDGLMDVLLGRLGGRRVHRQVTGPLGAPRRAAYASLADGKTAVVEMAQASGIAGLDPRRLDPLHATSYGTGELIRDALRRGARRIVVGLGGSATNDGGAGMAAALGVVFLDKDGKPLPLGAEPLSRLAHVDVRGLVFPRGVQVIAVSDVRNPLLGRLGSARVYGPQKGATPAMVEILERSLRRYAQVLKRDLGRDVVRIPGAGAAGALGAGLLAFLDARLVPGADWVLKVLDAERRVAGADLVLTGEGRLDEQSFYGKAPVSVARLAKKRGVAARFLCGRIEPGARTRLKVWGTDVGYPLSRPDEDPKAAMRQARVRLRRAAERAVRDFALAAAFVALAFWPARAQTADVSSATAFVAASFADFSAIDSLYFHRNDAGDLDRSQALLQELLRRDPSNVQVLWRLGRGWIRAGERMKERKDRLAAYRSAEDALKRSVRLDSNDADAHYWLGLAYGKRGETQGMLHSMFLVGPIKNEMKKTLELNPKYGAAHHVLGEMLRELPGIAGGSKFGAVREYEQALDATPEDTSLYADAAQAYLDAGQRDKAVEVLEEIDAVMTPADPAEYADDLKDARELLKKIRADR